MRKIPMVVAGLAVCMSAISALWGDVNVSAAISLKPALEEAQPLLEKAAGGPVSVNYGASGTLATQIRQGVPVDLLLSADRQTVDKLVAEKLADQASVTVIATGELVLITPADNPAHVTSLADVAGAAVKRIAIGEPKVVPAGAYAQATLTSLRLWEGLQKAGKVVTAENVAQALAFTAAGEVDAALVYATDARGNAKVKVILTAPADSHPPIEYVGAALRDAREKAAAAAVLKALAGPEVQKVFAAHGFAPPTPAAPATAPAASR